MASNYPVLDEFVLVTVKKIFPYGAIVSLDEYGGLEALLHISEVSSGWIRNIREHLKENQVLVVKIVNADSVKKQVDVSLKRVSEGDKKRKQQQYQSSKRSVKLFERASAKVGRTLNQAYTEAGNLLIKEYGDLYSAFEDISTTGTLKIKLPKAWEKALLDVAKQEIKQKIFNARGLLTLQCFSSNGLEEIKKILSTDFGPNVSIHYVGAPHYYLDVTGEDFKAAEKALFKIGEKIEAMAKGSEYNYALVKKEK